MHLLKGILACISIGITTVAVCVVLFFWWLQLALASAEKKTTDPPKNGSNHRLVDLFESLDAQHA
jgi:hypothetical protein